MCGVVVTVLCGGHVLTVGVISGPWSVALGWSYYTHLSYLTRVIRYPCPPALSIKLERLGLHRLLGGYTVTTLLSVGQGILSSHLILRFHASGIFHFCFTIL